MYYGETRRGTLLLFLSPCYYNDEEKTVRLYYFFGGVYCTICTTQLYSWSTQPSADTAESVGLRILLDNQDSTNLICSAGREGRFTFGRRKMTVAAVYDVLVKTEGQYMIGVTLHSDGSKLLILDAATKEERFASLVLPVRLETFQTWLGAYKLEKHAEQIILEIQKARSAARLLE